MIWGFIGLMIVFGVGFAVGFWKGFGAGVEWQGQTTIALIERLVNK